MEDQLKQLLFSNNLTELKNIIREKIYDCEAEDADNLYAFLYLAFAFENDYNIANKIFPLLYNPKETFFYICTLLQSINRFEELNKLIETFNEFSSVELSSTERDNLLDEIFGNIENNKDDDNENKDNKLISLSLDDVVRNFDNSIFQSDKSDSVSEDEAVADLLEEIERDNEAAFRLLSREQVQDGDNTLQVPIIVKDIKEIDNSSLSLSRKPRILFAMYDWNNNASVEIKYQKSIVKDLAKQGYDVTVFYAAGEHETNHNDYFMEYSEDEAVKLLGIYNRENLYLDIDNPLREIKNEHIAELFEYAINKSQADLIVFYSFNGLSFEIAKIAKAHNIPTIYEPFNYYLIDPQIYMFNEDKKWSDTNFFNNSILPKRFMALKQDYEKRIEAAKELLSETLDYIFVGSSHAKNIFSDFLNGNSSNIYVVNYIASQAEALNNLNDNESIIDENINNKDKENSFHFIYIGDYEVREGINIFAKAIQQMQDDRVYFDIYSNCSEEYKNILTSLDNGKNIEFHEAAVSHTDLLKLTQSNNIIVVPKIWNDPNPFNISEYLSLNIPVIASNTGGITDYIVDGCNGLLFLSEGAKALASAMKYIIENPFKIDAIKSNLRINKLEYSDYLNHKMKVYENIISGRVLDKNELEFIYNAQ